MLNGDEVADKLGVHVVMSKKQNKKWGPIQPTRRSNIIDRSRKMIDKANEMKMKSNLEISASAKMAGIMNSNPFHVLHVDDLDDMAKNVGTNLGKEIIQGNLVDNAREVVSPCLGPPVTPEHYDDVDDKYGLEDDTWRHVYSKTGQALQEVV
jgi:hypothetical protein